MYLLYICLDFKMLAGVLTVPISLLMYVVMPPAKVLVLLYMLAGVSEHHDGAVTAAGVYIGGGEYVVTPRACTYMCRAYI